MARLYQFFWILFGVLSLPLGLGAPAFAQVSADQPVYQGRLPVTGRVVSVQSGYPGATPPSLPPPQFSPTETVLKNGEVGAKHRYPFKITAERSQAGHQVIATNYGQAPISVVVHLKNFENLSSATQWPVFTVVPPRSTAILGTTQPTVPGTKYTFQVQSNWVPGDFNTQHNPDVLYRLPFREGKTFRITQAYGGKITTHTTPASMYAVDFPMPEGTPILAARSGVVVDVESSQTEGGQSAEMLKKANSIRILHQDGSLATYAHLAPGGVFVVPGQQVVAGAEIGLSGNTGYSSGPHLHFAVMQVQRTPDGIGMVSVPFKFYIGNPPIPFVPKQGMATTANYTGVAVAPTFDPPVRQEYRAQNSINQPNQYSTDLVYRSPAQTSSQGYANQ